MNLLLENFEMGDCGSKNTVDEKVQITTTLAESKSSNEEKLIMKPEFDSISDKQKPDSLYPPLSELEESSENIVFDGRRGSSSEDCAKKCPSAGYNFSRNSAFEASNPQNIAANNITTVITDSKSQIHVNNN